MIQRPLLLLLLASLALPATRAVLPTYIAVDPAESAANLYAAAELKSILALVVQPRMPRDGVHSGAAER